jgi:trypsin
MQHRRTRIAASLLPPILTSASSIHSARDLLSPADGSRVIGGVAAQTRRYPYAVSLQYAGEHFCGGSLIAPDIVLTAGHCNGELSVGIGTYNVVIGRYDLGKQWIGESIKVKDEVRHPGYDDITVDNDFNIVVLSQAATKTDVFVNLNVDASLPSVGDTVTVVGWGDTNVAFEVQEPSAILMETNMTSISNTQCENSAGLLNTEFGETWTDMAETLTENMMCAASLGKDACQGDSGGPLIARGSNGAGSDVQVGIVSWGLGTLIGFNYSPQHYNFNSHLVLVFAIRVC